MKQKSQNSLERMSERRAGLVRPVQGWMGIKKEKCWSFRGGHVRLLQVQRDAHVSQLFDRQQRRDDVLAKAVVY